MKEAIRQRAWELGFDDCRFTSAAPPGSARYFSDWIKDQQHGEMAWLARNAEKRVDPQQVLPGAKSLIVVAASYQEAPAEAPEFGPLRGVIARYARHEDYHDVLGRQLKQLSQFLRELAGPEIRSLWYVDTGPILERDFAQRAGLGFVGKHTNLISRRLGNWFEFDDNNIYNENHNSRCNTGRNIFIYGFNKN